MTRRFTRLAWLAATCTYLLIILGAIVRITGSGLGCGEHWPLCNGRLLPPLDLPTVIEYGHRLVALAVSMLVAALAAYAWWLRRETGIGKRETCPGRVAYVALALLILQIALGAVTVKLSLPPWTVILHLGTAMLLLATLLVAARGMRVAPPLPAGLTALALGFVTVLLGALTANLGAASACLDFRCATENSFRLGTTCRRCIGPIACSPTRCSVTSCGGRYGPNVVVRGTWWRSSLCRSRSRRRW